ncbi:MAG: DNA-binding protein [Thermoplasmata archaeon]|nr:DNA-binding protein [Thermoplasmata archaeon]
MRDEELAEIKKRKMEELLQQQQKNADLDTQKQEIESQKAAALRQILTPGARERLARLRLARPEVVAVVEQQLIALAQSGRLQQQVDDEALRGLLQRLVPDKREIKIERR